jgi:hypothetical protein
MIDSLFTRVEPMLLHSVRNWRVWENVGGARSKWGPAVANLSEWPLAHLHVSRFDTHHRLVAQLGNNGHNSIGFRRMKMLS